MSLAIFYQDFTPDVYLEHVVITQIDNISDDDVLRKINMLAMEGMEFMKEGMIRLHAYKLFASVLSNQFSFIMESILNIQDIKVCIQNYVKNIFPGFT